MKILRLNRPLKQDDHAPSLILIFGVGLIGSSIVSKILGTKIYSADDYPFSWDNLERQTKELEFIREKIGILTHPFAREENTVELIWSAGKSGFSSSREQSEQEYCTYRDVTISLIQYCKQLGARININLISSLGGLFEGVNYVKSNTIPDPGRPYGWLKLQQETHLDKLSSKMGVRIFRLTSVYGFVSNKHRMGLVPTLIRNGLRHEVTHIFGRLETLRDYVWVDDAAAFVVGCVLNQSVDGGKEIYTIASFRPRSVYEVKSEVEKVLRKRIYVAMSREQTNTGNISVSSELQPSGLVCSPLKLNIRMVAVKEIGSQWYK